MVLTTAWEATHVPDAELGDVGAPFAEKIHLSGPLPHDKWTSSRLYSHVKVHL